MDLRDKIEGVLGDFLINPGERQGALNNIMHYVNKHNKGAFVAGLILGAFSVAILINYFA
jgi:hypothetical protein